MKWHGNRELRRIESENPEIFVEFLRGERQGSTYVLNYFGRRFAFTTGFGSDKEFYRLRDDGSHVTVINHVCHEISGWPCEESNWKKWAVVAAQRFKTREEQDQILGWFLESFPYWEDVMEYPDYWADPEYSPTVLANIESGAYIKSSRSW